MCVRCRIKMGQKSRKRSEFALILLQLLTLVSSAPPRCDSGQYFLGKVVQLLMNKRACMHDLLHKLNMTSLYVQAEDNITFTFYKKGFYRAYCRKLVFNPQCGNFGWWGITRWNSLLACLMSLIVACNCAFSAAMVIQCKIASFLRINETLLTDRHFGELLELEPRFISRLFFFSRPQWNIYRNHCAI